MRNDAYGAADNFFADHNGAGQKVHSGNKISRAGAIAVCAVILLTAALIVCASPVFAITKIEISGNRYYDAETILQKSGLRVGQNGFTTLLGGNVIKMATLRCGGAERAVAAACPYVKSAQSRYVPPKTVRIDIVERAKSVIVPYYSSGLLMDEEGVVVDIVTDYKQYSLPVVIGVPVSRYAIGKKLTADGGAGYGDRAPAGEALDSGKSAGGARYGEEARAAESAVDRLLTIVSAIRQADRDSGAELMASLSEIDLSDPRDITLVLDDGVRARLGDGTELYYRVSVVKEIIAQGVAEGETGVISFYNGARPVFLPD